MTDIINASPMVIDLGTEDRSTALVSVSTLDTPQHLPKFYIFAETGPIGNTFVDFGSTTLTSLYGEDTFDTQKKYYTHQTPFLQAAAAAGNNCVVKRLMSPDAKDRSNVVMYIDVLPTSVTLHQKNVDGSLKLGTDGAPLPVLGTGDLPVTVPGYSVCWVTDHTVANLGEYEPGTLPVRNGIQVDGAVQSMQYPIFELGADFAGEYGNKIGIRLYPSLQTDQIPFSSGLLNNSKVYPYYFQVVKLADTISGKVNAMVNAFGSNFSRFTTKQGAIDPTSNMAIDFGKVVSDQYQNSNLPTSIGIGSVATYFNNIDTVLGMLYDAEKLIVDPHRDSVISNTTDNRYAINFVGLTSSNGSPYQALKMVNATGSVRLTRNSNLFFKGSTDGSISKVALDSFVAEDMEEYNSSTSEYNDMVLHPASIIYDSGFSLATKRSMCKFIGRRKDTFVILGTYSHDNPTSFLADQFSVGVSLKTMLELYPESDTFGTPVMRGMIMAGSGHLVNSLYKERVPLSYEVLCKAARYMGASNGAWRNGSSFDRAPLSIITFMKDLDLTWVPSLTRNAMWSVGLNFALNYRVKTQFFPALQTVYENDTSVLNSFFTAVAVSYLNKVAHSAWREFTGTVSLTNSQLEEQVNTYVAGVVKDKFDDKFVIVPDCKVTEADAARGFSWTLGIRIFSPNMKTVMSTSVTAFRLEE